MTRRLFAVERYDDSGGGSTWRPPVPVAATVRLVAAVHLPADEVVLVFVEGPDADVVAEALAEVGWPAHRVNLAVRLYPWGDQK
ncbi:hypothetical protein ACFYXS_26585 [Streptomyces sp. NPDC002574]|uniref:hypothetical protein n=1 Tax=Streptomyces sp. NPDC002574 TaxID=3364652 RepID=UPI0036A1A650